MDERLILTQLEKDKIIKNYTKNGRITIFPRKEKKKLIILQYVSEKFDTDRKYSETEINEIIGGIIDDYVSLRRSLIDYGFMERNNDGSEYWVKD